MIWGYTSRSEIEAQIAIINKFRGQWQLTQKANTELTNAINKLAELQKNCHHNWKIHTGLTKIERICEVCDKKDKDFDPTAKVVKKSNGWGSDDYDY